MNMTPEQVKQEMTLIHMLGALTFETDQIKEPMKQNWWNDFVLKVIGKTFPEMTVDELLFRIMNEQVKRKYGGVPQDQQN